MRAYIIRRLLLAIPSLLVVTIVLFLIIRLIPGNIIDLMVTEHVFSSAKDLEITAEAIRHDLGLDQPIYVQYGKWVWNIITPSFYLNVFWQPWMKGYEGVFYTGIYHYFKPFSYTWIDKS